MHTATITVNYYFTSQLLKPSCAAHVLLRESVWFLIRVWWVDGWLQHWWGLLLSHDFVSPCGQLLGGKVVLIYISVFMRMNTGEWNPARASEVPRWISNRFSTFIQSCMTVKSLHFLSLILFLLTFSTESSLAIPWPFVSVCHVDCRHWDYWCVCILTGLCPCWA